MADRIGKISREQARIFAYAIYRDIAAYVGAHQEDYQEFLKTEEENFNGKDTATHRPDRDRGEGR